MRFSLKWPFFGREKNSGWQPGPLKRVAKTEPPDQQKLRRWDAAQTHRLNEAHWSRVTGDSINRDLASYLSTLRIRVAHEIANNPLLEGVVETFATDVAGRGPKLTVESSSQRYNKAVEEAAQEYLAMPDSTGRLSMLQAIKLWVRQYCCCGEYLNQFVTGPPRQGPFRFAIRLVHPDRLETDPVLVGNADWALGIRLSEDNRPLEYSFRNQRRFGPFDISPASWQRVPAELVQHRYKVSEPDQIRGFPWFASALPVIADLRQFDQHVMEAAKNAAANAVTWHSDHPDAEFWDGNDEIELEPGMQTMGPPGWRPLAIQATQPSAQYVDFRHERAREMGRVIGMPLMMVILSSEGNSFSGAQHDGQIYIRQVEQLQTQIATDTLNPQIDQVALETRLARGLARPRDTRYVWTWTKPPHPNPKQQQEMIRMQVEDGVIAPETACALLGLDYDDEMRKRAHNVGLLAGLDLPAPPVNYGRGTVSAQAAAAESEGDANEETERVEPPAAA